MGTVFQVTTNGTLTKLIDFNGTNGANPRANLALGPDGNLYGTTSGGIICNGTVFEMTTAGILTTLIRFNGDNGSGPQELTLGLDGNLYGATSGGGSGGGGTIFQLDLPPDFITSPINQFSTGGGSATFSCRPFGTAPFAYQWLSNGVPIIGATSSLLTVANIGVGTTNIQFQVVVTNTWGSITSGVAMINLFPVIRAVSQSCGGNCSLSLGSYPNSTNSLWASTNLSQWQLVGTVITDTNGLSGFLDTNTVGMLWKFYRLSCP
jgi:uncharacterized repeat protein (TIGR03803 family)